MKTYNHYILENNRVDTTPLTMEEFDYLLNTHCKQFSFDDKPIYRGVDLKGDYYKIDPKLYTRKSARSGNIFNLIVSYSPYWEGIPSREKSIICSYDLSLCKGYGHVFRVIPFDNSFWGVSHTWLKIFNGFNLMNFNDAISEIFNEYNWIDYENLMATFKTLDINFIEKYMEKKKVSGSMYLYNMFEIIKNIMIKNNITFDKAILEFLKPNKNIKKLSYKELINKELIKEYKIFEMWTESACLLQKA